MCKVWKRPCKGCNNEMMLSGPSTSETHPGHREPCETYRRRQAECGGHLEKCYPEVAELWQHSGGPRKCETCRKVTRENAKIRRAERKAKITARKLEIQKKRRGQEFSTIASATSIEGAEAADGVNTLSPVQAQEPMIHQVNPLSPLQAQEPFIHQDTTVKTEPPPPPPYSERQNDEDVFWNLNPDKIAWDALLQYEPAQAQPTENEEQEQVKEKGQESVNQERSTTPQPSPSLPLEIQHHLPPPYSHHCTCPHHRHRIDIHRECSLKILMLFDALILDQFITTSFEYDPSWKAECGAILSREEQSDVLDVFFRAVKEGFGEVAGEQQGAGFESG
ncbi:hypothetical protein JMJ35_001388 [Cladonia borealis]|uniref:Uncharacterized protein n=1 Tax=Cladonia borealis TaxID=184061 RepID=A0AA39RAB2_9LECA|nr:hypothetical protein JMJ35_001388 [Cladonia borealis]